MQEFSLKFKAPFTETQVVKLRAGVLVWLEELEAPGEACYRLMAVVDELFCNLMEHSGATWAEVRGLPGDKAVSMEMKDDGKAFDSMDASKKDYSLYLQGDTDRKLGLYLISRAAKNLAYQRQDDGVNRITFDVSFDPPLPPGAENLLKK